MAQFKVKTGNARATADTQKLLADEMGRYETDLGWASGQLSFKIQCKADIQARLLNSAKQIETQRRGIQSLQSALQTILDSYEKTEQALLDQQTSLLINQAQQEPILNPDTPEKLIGDSAFEELLKKMEDSPYTEDLFENLLWNAVGGLEGAGPAVLLTRSVTAMMTVDTTQPDWQRELAIELLDYMGTAVPIEMGVGASAGWVVGLMAVKNGLDNWKEYDEKKGTAEEISWQRAMGEAFVETGVDSARKMAEKLPGIGGVIVSDCFSVADWACEILYDKDLAECAADKVLDSHWTQEWWHSDLDRIEQTSQLSDQQIPLVGQAIWMK